MKKRRDLDFDSICHRTMNEADAVAFAESLRWPQGITCHRCESMNIARLPGRVGRYRCRACARQFSIRSGTPMEASRLPVKIWLRGLWLILASSRGISSLRLGLMLGITQKTAWFMAHRIREMMAWCQSGPISGDVIEIDEVYAGAKPRRRPGNAPSGVKSGRGPRRPLVLTVVARHGDARMRRIESHDRASISAAAAGMIAHAGMVMTDALPAYGFLKSHRKVTHSAGEFSRREADLPPIHVNGAESLHGALRRMVIGVHHWLSAKHLQRYLHDLGFRHSLRETPVSGQIMAAISARGRISYHQLVHS